MSADQNILQGKVSENPVVERGDVERLLAGFVLALVREHESREWNGVSAPSADVVLRGGGAR